MAQPIEIYTDGSSLRNPGAAGCAYIIRYWIDKDDSSMPEIKEIEGSKGFRLSTNNRMELMAAIFGIKTIMEKLDEGVIPESAQINLYSDSDYLVKALSQNWAVRWMANNWMTSTYNGKQATAVKNKDLWEQIIRLQEELRSRKIILAVTHVNGHSGHEFNERADKLAVAASSGTDDKMIDEEYEKTSPYVIGRGE